MNVHISPALPHGTAAAPPSKSLAHRFLIGAALAEGESTVCGIEDSEDILATLDCIAALGVRFTRAGDRVTVFGGVGGADSSCFPCRESGSTLRFFLPLAAALCHGGRFTGTPRLLERGVGIYREVLHGVSVIEGVDALTVEGSPAAGEYVLRGDVSSQFITGLLYTLPLLGGDSTLRVLPPVESRPYIDLTLAALAALGIAVEEPSPNVFTVRGGQHFRAGSYRVEGDWSNAAFLYALNTVGGHVSVTGLSPDSLQGDRVCTTYFRHLLQEPQCPIDISACPDLGPVLFAVAAANDGGRFVGTRRLRIKESDRAQAMATELAKFGIRVTLGENSVEVHTGLPQTPNEPLFGHNDHRIVMALSVLAAKTGATVCGAEAVRKSYPTFFDTLRTLGMEVRYEF